MLRRIITPEVQQSLRALIDYLWDDERVHWQAGGRPKAHIYHDVRRVAEWLHDETGGGA